MAEIDLKKPGRLANKIAVITGSSPGIGRAIALAFAAEGASLVYSDITRSREWVHRRISQRQLCFW
jgi:NAD(P)-dependent dehydrogenase (short-subunit alcohol dehydrogenase family)